MLWVSINICRIHYQVDGGWRMEIDGIGFVHDHLLAWPTPALDSYTCGPPTRESFCLLQKPRLHQRAGGSWSGSFNQWMRNVKVTSTMRRKVSKQQTSENTHVTRMLHSCYILRDMSSNGECNSNTWNNLHSSYLVGVLKVHVSVAVIGTTDGECHAVTAGVSSLLANLSQNRETVSVGLRRKCTEKFFATNKHLFS